MGVVRVSAFSVSLDGFGAGPNQVAPLYYQAGNYQAAIKAASKSGKTAGPSKRPETGRPAALNSVPRGAPFCARDRHLPAETRAERGACGWRWMGLRYANAKGEP